MSNLTAPYHLDITTPLRGMTKEPITSTTQHKGILYFGCKTGLVYSFTYPDTLKLICCTEDCVVDILVTDNNLWIFSMSQFKPKKRDSLELRNSGGTLIKRIENEGHFYFSSVLMSDNKLFLWKDRIVIIPPWSHAPSYDLNGDQLYFINLPNTSCQEKIRYACMWGDWLCVSTYCSNVHVYKDLHKDLSMSDMGSIMDKTSEFNYIDCIASDGISLFVGRKNYKIFTYNQNLECTHISSTTHERSKIFAWPGLRAYSTNKKLYVKIGNLEKCYHLPYDKNCIDVFLCNGALITTSNQDEHPAMFQHTSTEKWTKKLHKWNPSRIRDPIRTFFMMYWLKKTSVSSIPLDVIFIIAEFAAQWDSNIPTRKEEERQQSSVEAESAGQPKRKSSRDQKIRSRYSSKKQKFF